MVTVIFDPLYIFSVQQAYQYRLHRVYTVDGVFSGSEMVLQAECPRVANDGRRHRQQALQRRRRVADDAMTSNQLTANHALAY